MKYAASLILAFILAWGKASFCQGSEINKLLSEKNDTAKVGKLLGYGQALIEKDTTQANKLFLLAKQLGIQLKYPNGVGSALFYLGRVALNNGKYNEAEQYYRQALYWFHQANNTRLMASCYNFIGGAFAYRGQTDSSIFYLLKSVESLEKDQFLPELSKAYVNLGIMYLNINDNQKCITYEEKGMAISKKLKDTFLLSRELSTISSAYRQMGAFSKAYDYALRALKLAQAKNDDVQMLSAAYDTYSNACVEVKMYDEAIAAGKKALEYANSINQVQLIISATTSLAAAYKEKGDYKEGVAIFKQVLNKCKDVDNVLFLRDIYRVLAEGNYQLGNYKEAYENYVNYNRFEDTLLNEQNNQTIAELDIKYQTSQKEKALSEKELQVAKKEVQLQQSRQFSFYSITVTAVALLLAGFAYVYYRNRKKLLARQLEALQKEKELQLLQALMQGEEKERSRIAKDLHDGVAGMLAAIKMHFSSIQLFDNELTHTEGYQQGMKLLNEVTSEIRKTSHNLMPEVLLQHGLDEALRRYCNSVNNNRSLQIQYDSWGDISRYKDSFELSVYRIVQELINNIIKHSKATQAFVQVTQQEELLSISIEDNGIGFTRQDNGNDGIGLRSLQRRVKAMNGRMELQTSEQSGVSAYMEFEIKELKKDIAEVYE